jgi:CO/xanthine dehydrogenase Mo-binding subunit
VTSYIGKSITRVDAAGKVTGQAKFPGDINAPDQLYMKILFSSRAHAVIKRVETSDAEKLEGVVAVFSAKDVPVNEYGLIIPDQPDLCGPVSVKPFTDRVRFIGDQIAVVIAESEEIAAEAIKKILVIYEDLPRHTDPRESKDDIKILVHPDRSSNVFCHYRIRKGDIDTAFQKADVIVEGCYQTPYQEHAYLQPEAGISYIDDAGRVTVVVGGQWVHEDQEQIAHALNIPVDQVRVIYPSIGGAFGGREDMSVQIVLALAVWRLHQAGISRPVKIIWSREESIIGHHKRHPFFITSKWGATKDGKIIAAQVELIADGGGYAYTTSKVLGNATVLAAGPYEIPNIRVDSFGVYTNNIPTGAFRGFGGPQAAFAAEMQMDKLAEKLGMDPVELRMRNIIKEGSLLSVGTPLPKGVSMPQVAEKCALTAGWQKYEGDWVAPVTAKSSNPDIQRGIGFACGFKNVGFSFGAPEHCWATVELHGGDEIDKVVLHHAGADVGQGSHTIFTQFAAEALGVSTNKIQLVVTDTAFTENSGSVSASRMTFMSGNAIKGACELALQKWKNAERPAVAAYQYRPPRTTPLDPETGKSEPNFAYGYVSEAVELEVNVQTGKINILSVICVDDVGQAVNPMAVQGQIEGAVVQAAGYAILENFIEKDAVPVTTRLSTYLIPTILDIPESVQSVILEYPDPLGPYGARGMGEMPYLPFVPALMAAVHDAIGIWFDEFPLQPEKVLKALGKF